MSKNTNGKSIDKTYKMSCVGCPKVFATGVSLDFVKGSQPGFCNECGSSLQWEIESE